MVKKCHKLVYNRSQQTFESVESRVLSGIEPFYRSKRFTTLFHKTRMKICLNWSISIASIGVMSSIICSNGLEMTGGGDLYI